MCPRRIALFSLLLVASDLGSALAQPQPIELPGKKLKSLPWHLVGIQWDFPSEISDVEKLSIDLSIRSDIPDSADVFLAPINTTLNGQTTYAGFITNQMDVLDKDGRHFKNKERGVMYSRWGPAVRSAIRTSVNDWHLIANHEGEHVSVRPPFRWSRGSYRIQLVRMDKEIIGDQVFVWVGCFIKNLTTNEDLFAGALRFEGSQVKVPRSVSSFVEIVGHDRDAFPQKKTADFDIAIGNLCINGRAAEISLIRARYFEDVPDYAKAVMHIDPSHDQRRDGASQASGSNSQVLIQVRQNQFKRPKLVETLFQNQK